MLEKVLQMMKNSIIVLLRIFSEDVKSEMIWKNTSQCLKLQHYQMELKPPSDVALANIR